MEETWELAALMMSEIFKHDLEARDWSAKHTRLKFQMLLSVILFLVLKNYEPSSINLLVFRFNDGLPAEVVKNSMLIFCIYSFIAFLFRSIHETPKSGTLSSYDVEVIREARKLLIKAKKLIETVNGKRTLDNMNSLFSLLTGEVGMQKVDYLDETLKGLNKRFDEVLDLYHEARVLLNAAGFKETDLYKVVESSENELSLIEEEWPSLLSLSLEDDLEEGNRILQRSMKISNIGVSKLDATLSENFRRRLSNFLEIWALGVLLPILTFILILFWGDTMIEHLENLNL